MQVLPAHVLDSIEIKVQIQSLVFARLADVEDVTALLGLETELSNSLTLQK